MTSQKDFENAARVAVEKGLAWRSEGPKFPAGPTATTEELRQKFRVGLPEEGRDGVEVIENLSRAAEGGLMNNTHPNFYAWVQGASHPVGCAADMLTTAWGQNGGIFQTAPAAAIAEETAGEWLKELLQLPADSSFEFTSGATMASFTALVVARAEVLRRAGYDIEEEGFAGAPPIKIFVGGEVHTTILSGLRTLGIGRKEITSIAVDDQGRMQPESLAAAMAQVSGPCIVIMQAGHINSGAFDPFKDLIPLAHAHGAWVHIDGAFGLWARAVPQLRHLCEGAAEADSWTVDGHKWLQVPYDSGFTFIRDEEAHRRAMSVTASYIAPNPDDGRNPTHYGPELSRRARGFTVWAVLQAFGRKGVEEMVARHVRCARQLDARFKENPMIHVLNQVDLNQLAIAFSLPETKELDDALTIEVIARLQSENKVSVQGAEWKGRKILRISIVSQQTDSEDIDFLGEQIEQAYAAVLASRSLVTA